MARPRTTLTVDQVRKVETLAALLNQDQIADYFGIVRNTFRAICERDPEVLARYKKGKARAIAHVANGLLQKARSGDTTSMIFYLKTQAGWRETDRMEHTGAEGAPIAVSDAREKLQKHLDCIAERLGRADTGGAIGVGDLIAAGGEGQTLAPHFGDRRGEAAFHTAMIPTGGQTDRS